MNYLFLKNIIASILENFHCPECKNRANESSLNIQKISHHGVDIAFECEFCHSRAVMKAELGKMASDFLATDAGKNFFKNSIQSGQIIVPNLNKKPGISADEIHKIEEKLSKNTTINDLINGDQNP